MSDTIAAIATARAPSAIGILRLTGPDTVKILDTVFRPKGRRMSSRPDRVMVSRRSGEVVVVDFKFGKTKDLYEAQVREYIRLLQEMGHEQVGGYLWYVYKGEIRPVMPLDE